MRKRPGFGTCKATCNFAATTVVAPIWLAARLLGILGIEALPAIVQVVSLIPGQVGVFLRRSLLRLALRRCGSDLTSALGAQFVALSSEVGDRVYIGLYCVIGEVTVGDDVLVGSRVSIINGGRQHAISRLDVPVREQPGEWPRITIGRDTWIGDGAIVMADVGHHCVVGAGSVVTKPVPDFAIVAGNPARIMRYRDGAPLICPVGVNRSSVSAELSSAIAQQSGNPASQGSTASCAASAE